MENYEVEKIDLKGSMTISYSFSVTKADGTFAKESLSVTKHREAHQDFKDAAKPVLDMIRRLVELPLVNCYGERLTVTPLKIKFLDSDKLGRGVKFTVALTGFGLSDEKITLSTPAYYKTAKLTMKDQHGTRAFNMLTEQEFEQLEKLKHEAFLYAHHNKCLQPTTDEALEAEANGGFADELVDGRQE